MSRRKLSKIDGKIKKQRLFGGPWNCDGLISVSTLADEFQTSKVVFTGFNMCFNGRHFKGSVRDAPNMVVEQD
jgi:hypothetical protein